MTGVVFPGRAGSSFADSGESRLPEPILDPETAEIAQRIQALRTGPSPGSLPPRFRLTEEQKSLEERLFDALAGVKILTSQVAMHLDSEWRARLFRQLDALHDPEEWDEDGQPIQESSFATFLKAILSIRPERPPGLGLSDAGYLIASWTTAEDHLNVEFLSNDRVRWVLSRHYDHEVERVASDTSVARLAKSLAPYCPEHWFSRAS